MSAADPTWFHLLGGDGGSIYDYESAPIPLLAYASVVAAAYHHLRERNCHEHACWRMGRVPHPDGVHRVCKRHWHLNEVSPTGAPPA